MAKRKNAAALFEVYNDKTKAAASRPLPSARSGGWFFKGRSAAQAPAAEQAYDENDPTTMTIRSPLLAPRIAAVESMPPVTGKSSGASVPDAIAAPRVEPRSEADAIRQRMRDMVGGSSSRLQLDPTSREVSLRLPVKLAIIAAFGIIVSMGIAYIVGRHTGSSQADSDAKAEKPREANLRPSALDLPRHPAHPQMPPADSKLTPRLAAAEIHPKDQDPTPVANSVKGISPVAKPMDDQGDGQRIIGLNYILIQNYPTQASAAEARDFLVQNGIACTVEKVPPGFYCPDPNWMAVITSRGFDKEELHAPEYDEFKRQIEKLGDKFAGNGRFKRFSLQLYKLK